MRKLKKNPEASSSITNTYPPFHGSLREKLAFSLRGMAPMRHNDERNAGHLALALARNARKRANAPVQSVLDTSLATIAILS
jgi:hypothetical protein